MLLDFAEKLPPLTNEEVRQVFVNTLDLITGFSILFMQCSPAEANQLIPRVQRELPDRKIGVLELGEPINKLYKLVADRADRASLNILFIRGLEKSLESDIKPGYKGLGDYYNLNTIPPILSHLNQQRENFRDHFGNICFVFVLPRFAIRYFVRRAPDFYDWNSGVFEIKSLSIEDPIAILNQLPDQTSLKALRSSKPIPHLILDCYTNLLLSSKSWNQRFLINASNLWLWIKFKTTKPAQNNWINYSFIEYLDQGDALFKSGKYEKAITLYDQAIDIKNNSYEALYNRGLSLYKLGKCEEAISSYNNAIAIQHNIPEAWNSRGISLSRLGRYEEAIVSYDHALAIKPNFFEACYNRGISLDNLGRYTEAEIYYELAYLITESDPWSNMGSFLKKFLYSRKKHIAAKEMIKSHDRAIPDKGWLGGRSALDDLGFYEMIVKLHDWTISFKNDDHKVWYSQKSTLDNLGCCEKVIESYDQTISDKHYLYNAWYNLAVSLDNSGHYEEAIKSYDWAISLEHDLHEDWSSRGSTLDKFGRYEEAIKSYDQAIFFKSDDHKVWYNRGNSLGNLGCYEEAVKSYDQAISFKHDLHEALYNRGVSLGNLGRYEEAIKSYDQAISFKHDLYEAWYKRGISLDNLGRYEEAIKSYDQAISFKNDLHEAWYNRGISLDNLGHYEEAIKSCDWAIFFKPDLHEVWLGRGVLLDKLGRHEEAIESYDRAISFNPNNGLAWHNRGDTCFKLGKYLESISCYDQRTTIQPDKYTSWHDKGLVHFVTNDYLATLDSWQQAFKYISDPAVPRYQEDIPGLIQEFIKELISRFTQPPIQQTLLIPLLEIYQQANVITELGTALINTLHLIIAPAISDHTATQWLALWRTSSLGNEPAMELPLRLMSTAIEYKKDPSKRQRLWLNLPSEERPILDKALKLLD